VQVGLLDFMNNNKERLAALIGLTEIMECTCRKSVQIKFHAK